MSFQFAQGRKGFSAVESLIGIGLFSISLLASVSFFSQVNNGMSQQTNSINRLRLFQGLIYMFGMPTTLRGSLNNDTPNGMLSKSINGDIGTIPTSPLPIALFLPIVSGTATTVLTSGMISGTPAEPLQYSLSGTTCLPAVGTLCDPQIYPIAVSTEFLPVCPAKFDYYRGKWVGPVLPLGLAIPNSCFRAQYIKVIYTLKPAAGAPSDLQFTPVTGSIMVSAVLVNAVI
jgi:hypothetical protein